MTYVNKDEQDYVVTLAIAGCAPILLRAYSVSHVHEKIQACMPGATVLRCELRRNNRKRLMDSKREGGKPRRSVPKIPTVNTPSSLPTLRVVNADDLAGV